MYKYRLAARLKQFSWLQKEANGCVVPSRGYVYVWSNFRNRMIGRRFVQSEADYRRAHVAEVCALTWKKELADGIKPTVSFMRVLSSPPLKRDEVHSKYLLSYMFLDTMHNVVKESDVTASS